VVRLCRAAARIEGELQSIGVPGVHCHNDAPVPVKLIYTAVNATAARSAFDELTEKWGQRYPGVIRTTSARVRDVRRS
jgi:hypothetical protein